MKLYKDLGTESKRFGQQFRHICTSNKTHGRPKQLCELIPFKNKPYTSSTHSICAYTLFTYIYIKFTLDLQLRNAGSFQKFRNTLLKLVLPTPDFVLYGIHLPLGLSHLNKHKLKHNFEDYINSLRIFALKVESAKYFFICTAIIIQHSIFLK